MKLISNHISIFIGLLLLCATVQTSAQSIDYDGKTLKISLSEDVQAAIDNGLSITFENELVHFNKWFLIGWHSNQVTHSFVIKRHTLSNRYLVHEVNQVIPHIFQSTREAMSYIGSTSIQQFRNYHFESELAKPDSHSLTPHKMRLRLNKTKLPGPMRLTAFIDSAWNINSGWTEWPSDQ